MYSKRLMIFAAAACLLGMLAYVFVFAEEPISDFEPPAANPAAPAP
jgi:hypothetical protein